MGANLSSVLERYFAFVDIALAQLLLGSPVELCDEAMCFLAYLSMATRHGHLCIQVDGSNLVPYPGDMIQEDESGQSLSDEDIQDMTASIICGAAQLPPALISSVDSSAIVPLTPICRDGTRYYFQRYWVQESSCLQRLVQGLTTPPALTIDAEFASKYVENLIHQKLLLPEQGRAILHGCNRSISLVCGGPGTGKTYTAAHWIALFWKALSPEQRRRTKIALAAPTGKAAANLQKSLSKVVDTLEQFKPVQAKTLHSLLGISSREPAALTADLILVDESSMIDVNLMAALLKAVKPGARLIFLGDPYQLPPVEAGGVFKDIVQVLLHFPGYQPADLQTCMRMESEGLIQLAQRMRSGDGDQAMPFVDLNAVGPTALQRQQALFKQVARHFVIPFDAVNNPQERFTLFNRFRLLSPLRKGPYGVDALNDCFMQALVKEGRRQGIFAAPIMVTRNTAELNLYNGDVGVLVKPMQSSDEVEGSFALFESATTGLARKIPAVLLPPFEYAYCLSVHKSQGSEFDHVLLLMPEGAEVFGREVLYTAVTRAKKKLEVWSTETVLQNALKRPSQRLSGISSRLPKLLGIVS